MDALSHILFGQQSTVVHLVDAPSVTVQEIAESLWGRPINDKEYAAIVGAPDDSLVTVIADNGARFLTIIVENDVLFAEVQKRRVAKRNNELVIYNDNFVLHDTVPVGVGTRIFARQVENAHRMGISRLLTTASGSRNDPDYNGYYTWIRLGFNAELSPNMQARLANYGFEKVENTNDLITSPGGAEWWRENGVQCHAEFDLTPGSPMRGILNRYLKEQEVAVNDGI